MQSVGMTSKPTPGADYDSSGLCFYMAALRRKKDVDLAGDIEIVGLTVEAGVNHRRTGGRERAGTVRHNRYICERRRSRLQIKDRRAQTKFGR